MKWQPRTMAGQLFALLLLALGITHFIAVLVLTQFRTTEQIHPLSANEIEIRIASVYRAITGNPDYADILVVQFSAPESIFELIPSQPQSSSHMTQQEEKLAQNLRKRLNLPENLPVQVQLQEEGLPLLPEETMDQSLRKLTPTSDRVLSIKVGLPDGQTLHSRSLTMMMHGHWARVLGFSIPVGLLPIFVIAIIFGRRIMRPLKALTDAARRISRGENPPKMIPEGPSDMREVIETFNDMQERLTRYVDDRTRMIAAIGHDLRTPLTSLRIRAELIDDSELREAMIGTLNEMTAMTEETLQFAKDNALAEPTQRVSLSGLIKEIINNHKVLGGDVTWIKGSEIHYDCRPIHMKRAINNLIDNAARYGKVHVKAYTQASSKELKIEITDDGPGVPPDQVERIFEPFVRLDTTRNLECGGGTGLGLAIARSCVRAHGGELSIHNRAEGGLRAIISLPL